MGQAKVNCCFQLCILTLLSATVASANRNVILPGHSIGKVKIGAEVPKSLGKPAWGDGATGKFWESWVSRKSPRKGEVPYQLDVYSRRGEDDIEAKVVQVRVNSPAFSTPTGVSTRSNLTQIRKRFPNAQLYATYRSEQRHGSVYVYDDVKQGIAFEIWRGQSGKGSSARCLAISVHAPGQNVVPVIKEQLDDWRPISSSKRNHQPLNKTSKVTRQEF